MPRGGRVKPVLLAAIFVLLLQLAADISADDSEAPVEEEEEADARYRCVDRRLKSAADLRYVEQEEEFGGSDATKTIHVAMIATNVNRYNPNNPPGGTPVILQVLGKMITSILDASRGTPLHIIMITDEDSHALVEQAIMKRLGQHLSEGIIREPEKSSKFPRHFCLELVSLESFTIPNRALIDQMKQYYARSLKDKTKVTEDGTVLYYSYEKYTLDLFFLAPFYHLCFPSSLKQLIVLDVDLEVRIDLQELQHQFDLMTPDQVVGVVNDQFAMYKMYYENTLRLYPTMNISEAFGKGFNTGVVLYDLEKIRQSATWAAEIASPAAIDQLARKHWMVGTVGDQDWMTLMGFEHPELIRILPCEFNLQVHPLQGITCQQPPKIGHKHGLL
jgi:lipopolysaccharide biosynthesis glycosyltransferase